MFFGYGVMMIMPNEKGEWVRQFRCIHSIASYIQRDNSDF